MPSRQKNMTRACRWHSKRHDCSNCRSRKYFPIKTKLCGISSRRVASSLKCDKTCFRSATVYREKDISVSMQTLTPQEEGACVGTEMSGGQPLPSCRTSNLNPPGLTSRRSQPPLALSVRYRGRWFWFGGGSAFYVRRLRAYAQNDVTDFTLRTLCRFWICSYRLTNRRRRILSGSPLRLCRAVSPRYHRPAESHSSSTCRR